MYSQILEVSDCLTFENHSGLNEHFSKALSSEVL